MWYGADILAGAGWFKERKDGHAYFFPGKFSDRAGKYFEKYGRERTRQGMAKWFQNAVENARLCPTAQEYHNKTGDLFTLGLTEPNPKTFVDHLNVFDCSKVSDGASAIAIVSEEGLVKIGASKSQAVEILSFIQATADLTSPPADLTQMSTTAYAAQGALKSAGITAGDLATVETHDCFTIAGVMAVEAIGLAKQGEGADFVLEGNTARTGQIPFNTTGGLIGWGHPTGCTGIHQAVTIWEQLTNHGKDAQISIPSNQPYGLSINMGGDDKTLVSIVYRPGE